MDASAMGNPSGANNNNDTTNNNEKTNNMNNNPNVLQHAGNMMENKQTYITYQDKISLVNGVVTGILQLESFAGFRNFFIIYFLCSGLYVLFICKGKPSRYYNNVLNELIFENLIRELLGFVMAWTFSYALVG